MKSKVKSLGCFLDTSTINKLAGCVKYNQEERVDEIAKLTKAQRKVL